MHAHELALELEALLLLLLLLLPDRAAQWQGATPAEIQKIEQLAGRPLPEIYRWFLSRMGKHSGLQTYPTIDFSAAKIIASYAEGEFAPDLRFLLIGYDSSEYMPLHLFYDFDHPAQDDALVVAQEAVGDPQNALAETLRTMLASAEFVRSRVRKLPQQCKGLFEVSAPDLLSRLGAVMTRLGFLKAITPGSRSALYDRPDAAMSFRANPGEPPGKFVFFKLGGSDSGVLRQILGTLAIELSLRVEIDTWTPHLS